MLMLFPDRRPYLRDTCRVCDRTESREYSERQKEQQESQEHLFHSISEQGESPVNLVATVNLGESPVLAVGHTPEELRQAQRSDKELKPVIEWMEKSTSRPPWEETAPHGEYTKVYWSQWQGLHLSDGLLYRLWETPSGDSVIKQLVLPKALRPEVLQQLHSTPTAGHLGVTKTLGRVRERFYWVNCRQDVQDWCQICDTCAKKRGPQKKVRAPMGQYNVGSPMERLALDVLGPLPLTEDGNKYILIVADYFTKWVEAYPLPNQEAPTVAEVLVKEYVCHFGVPLLLHSDIKEETLSQLCSKECANCLVFRRPEPHHTTLNQTGWLKGLTGLLKLSCPNLQTTTRGTGMSISLSS